MAIKEVGKNQYEITIDSIMGGVAPYSGVSVEDQFNGSLGIDPDWFNATGVRPTGMLTPTAYSDISGAGLSGYPRWIITNPKNTNIYIYASDGEFISYNSALGSETVIGTPTAGIGDGAAYYNNYIYLATPTNVSRYGPLDGTPTISNTFWGTTLGLTLLDSTITYPTGRGVLLPRHPMHVHTDGALYFGDFDAVSVTDTNRGKGLIHKIKTKYGTSGTAHQGAVNDGSAYNSLDLPYDYLPMDIESYGTDLVVAAMQNTDTTIVQGKASLFFWDTFSESFYRQVPLPDPVVTALYNQNGDIIVWSGSMNNGVRVSRYLGGYSFEELAFFEEGTSPSAGAIDGLGKRLVWGSFTTYPENSASIFSLGYKKTTWTYDRAIHNIVKTNASASSTVGMVSALKYAQHASFINPRLLAGWVDSVPNFGLDAVGSTYGVSVFRSRPFYLGKWFQIKRVIIPLGAAVGANMTLIPKIFTDDENASTALTTINSTNYTASELIIDEWPNAIYGNHNFLLELRWSGTSSLPVKLPITILVETFDGAKS